MFTCTSVKNIDIYLSDAMNFKGKLSPLYLTLVPPLQAIPTPESSFWYHCLMVIQPRQGLASKWNRQVGHVRTMLDECSGMV